jgi:hypothetical protein
VWTTQKKFCRLSHSAKRHAKRQLQRALTVVRSRRSKRPSSDECCSAACLALLRAGRIALECATSAPTQLADAACGERCNAPSVAASDTRHRESEYRTCICRPARRRSVDQRFIGAASVGAVNFGKLLAVLDGLIVLRKARRLDQGNVRCSDSRLQQSQQRLCMWLRKRQLAFATTSAGKPVQRFSWIRLLLDLLFSRSGSSRLDRVGVDAVAVNDCPSTISSRTDA